MRRFAHLYFQLDATTKTNKKLAALRNYFAAADPADAAWAIYFLTGHKPKRLMLSRNLAAWAAEVAGLPDWLFAECYEPVGDFAETIALVLPPAQAESELPLTEWVEDHLLPLKDQDEAQQRAELRAAWDQMSFEQRFVWNKLLTGEFRVGVSQRLVVRALAEVAGLDPAVIAHRLMGDWSPTADAVRELLSPETESTDISRPYPFFLAHPLDREPGDLGPVKDWLAEWKWDGIRAQLIRRGGRTFLWSRGEEMVNERFPETVEDSQRLPDGVVLDGEIVAWKDGAVLPFAKLQRRIGRKNLSKRILETIPARLIAFDLLEFEGEDCRNEALRQRREQLSSVLAKAAPSGANSDNPLQSQELAHIAVSETVTAATWEDLASQRERAREHRVEGLMLKRLDSPYGVGRQRGPWWKWKIDPYTIDAVLIYAQPGHGRRASLFTDYTFGVWKDNELVPFAKAYSGLSDAEIREVDRFVRRNTLEKFGPVRRVKPELVFELAFENIQRSTRHKSGLAVRFPRMTRWRHDKKPEEADTLEAVETMIEE